MCHFLTISVPAATVPEVPEHLRREIHFTSQLNRSVTVHTPPEWISFVATSGGCSCDLYRASRPLQSWMGLYIHFLALGGVGGASTEKPWASK
jgi:hypothetical protein